MIDVLHGSYVPFFDILARSIRQNILRTVVLEKKNKD